MLIFGGAIAVAQLAGGLLPSSRDAVLVELVSSGMNVKTGRGARSAQGHEAPHAEEQPQEQPRQVSPDTQADGAMPANDQVVENDNSRREGVVVAASSSGPAFVSDARSGNAVPGEWALLAAALERTKDYPRLARERGIEGVVRLRFSLSPTGAVEKVEILRSSGHEILDSASIRAVYRAAPMPYVRGWVELPMAYVLK